MAEQTRSLRDGRSVVLDAQGAGQVSFGPQRPNTRWIIRRVALTVGSNAREPEARIYRGSVSASLFLSGTFSGSNDADDGLNEELFPGDVLIVRWTGGDVGATATAAYSGDEISGAA